MIKIEGQKHLVRDPHSKAILNTNRQKIEEYRLKTEAIKKQKEQEQEIQNLKVQVNEILQILKEIRDKN